MRATVDPNDDNASQAGGLASADAATIKHLSEMADAFECGAKMEDAIVAAYQPELDAFGAVPRNPEAVHDIRLIRAVLDARSNRDRFAKDAAALRTVLALADGASRHDEDEGK